MTYDEELEVNKHIAAMKLWSKIYVAKDNAYSQVQSVIKANSVVADFYESFKDLGNE